MFGFSPVMMRPTGAPPGQQEFTTIQNASVSWTVPDGVTMIAAVAIGAGTRVTAADNQGSGGGALSYDNAITVTPGETLTIIVGGPYAIGADSSVARGATILLRAKGASGQTGGQASSGIGAVKHSGGDGLSGTKGDGGAAGRYDGDGAAGAGAAGYGGEGTNLVGGYNPNTGHSINGMSYGGGTATRIANPGWGAVRVMWGTGRSYPSNAGDV
jgi:hypothetical protein